MEPVGLRLTRAGTFTPWSCQCMFTHSNVLFIKVKFCLLTVTFWDTVFLFSPASSCSLNFSSILPSHAFSVSHAVLTNIFFRWTWASQYENVYSLDFIGAKDDGDGGGDKWGYKTGKAPVKLSPPANRHPAFYGPDALPVAQPTVSEHWREILLHALSQTIRQLLSCGSQPSFPALSKTSAVFAGCRFLPESCIVSVFDPRCILRLTDIGCRLLLV